MFERLPGLGSEEYIGEWLRPYTKEVIVCGVPYRTSVASF
jgi:aryl-alcohol dehydrogenase-like predicted oxidoreductase